MVASRQKTSAANQKDIIRARYRSYLRADVTFAEDMLTWGPKYTGKERGQTTQGQCFSTYLSFLCHLNTGILSGNLDITGSEHAIQSETVELHRWKGHSRSLTSPWIYLPPIFSPLPLVCRAHVHTVWHNLVGLQSADLRGIGVWKCDLHIELQVDSFTTCKGTLLGWNSHVQIVAMKMSFKDSIVIDQ